LIPRKGTTYYDDGIRVAILSNDCIRVSTIFVLNDLVGNGGYLR